MRRHLAAFSAPVLLLALLSCESARLPVSDGIGPDPQLPPPRATLIPTVHIAPAKGWPGGVTPHAAEGLAANAFATGLDHPRWLYVLPNGDVLVAETNAPPKRHKPRGIKARFMAYFMRRAGAAVPSANRITLLRDSDGDGVAESRTPFLTGLNSPFGMALTGNTLYVANTDAVVRFSYRAGATAITEAPITVAPLPAGENNFHWSRNLVASADGTRLYVSVGSDSNMGEGGMDREDNRAAVLEIDASSGRSRVFASGLRNPVGLAWEPQSGTLWATVNERDEIGSDLVPDFLTSLKDAASTGGRTATSDSTSIRASRIGGPILFLPRSFPTTHWERIPPRLASRFTTRTCCRPVSLAERSSASMARGTGGLPVDTR